jgi:hypothetical protein
MTGTVDEYLAPFSDQVAEMMLEFREAVLASGPEVLEKVHRTEISWTRKRVFAGAFVKSGRLEVSFHLLRAVEHPRLRESFYTTKKVITHRLAFDEPGQVDEKIRSWLVEAYETVGPGTR